MGFNNGTRDIPTTEKDWLKEFRKAAKNTLTTPLEIYFRHRNKKHVAVHCDDTYFHLNGDITENHFNKEKTNLCLKEPFKNLEKEGTGKHTQLPAGAVLKTIRYIAYTGRTASIVHDTQIRVC